MKIFDINGSFHVQERRWTTSQDCAAEGRSPKRYLWSRHYFADSRKSIVWQYILACKPRPYYITLWRAHGLDNEIISTKSSQAVIHKNLGPLKIWYYTVFGIDQYTNTDTGTNQYQYWGQLKDEATCLCEN